MKQTVINSIIILCGLLFFAGPSVAYEEKEAVILKKVLKEGNLKEALIFINNGKYDYERKKRASFAFAISAGLGRIDYCKTFHKMGAQPGFSTNWFDRSMVQAVRGNHFEIVKYLVDLGQSPGIEKEKLVKAAAEVGMTGFVDLCKKLGIRINTNFMLKTAVLKGQSEMVDYLLKNKTDPYPEEKDGTLLFSSAFRSIGGPEKNRENVIKAFVENKVDFNHPNSKGWTAVALALKSRDRKMVERLIENGANPLSNIDNAVSMGENIKKSLLSLSAVSLLKYTEEQYSKMTEILKKGGNISELIDSDNPSREVKQKRLSFALNRAIRNGNASMTETLISLGADLTEGGYENKTPLYIAIESKFSEVIKVLIKNKVDVNSVINREIPLYMAVKTNSPEVVKALLKGKPKKKPYGNLALFHAIKLKNSEIVKILLDYGADPNIPKTLLNEIPYIKGYGTDTALTDIEKLLTGYGADRLSKSERKNKEKEKFGYYVLLTLLSFFGIGLGQIGVRGVYNAVRTLKWPEVQADVISSKVIEEKKIKIRFRIRFFYIPLIKYRYRVNDETHNGNEIYMGYWKSNNRKSAEKLVERYHKGAKVPVYYDPEFPSDAVLQKGITHPLNYFLSGFFILGAVSVIILTSLLIF